MLVEQSRKMMGTEVGIHVAATPEQEEDARASIAACFAWLEDIAARLTRFDAASELSQLNVAAGTWRAVSEVLFTVLEQSLAAARASDGLFDPALLGLLEALGYDRDFKAITRENVQREVQGRGPVGLAASNTGVWRDIQLDAARRRVRLPPGARLDLGGIVKGWAADVALDRFFAPYMGTIVDVGGDMGIHGKKADEELWPIGISPDVDGPSTAEGDAEIVVTLGHGGLATSGAAGATGRWWYSDGARQHHLLDPRTGRPARLWIDAGDDQPGGEPLIASATALAPTAAHAEVAAKVALLRGFPAALRAVEAAWTTWSETDAAEVPAYGDAGVALVLVLGSGEVACSDNLRAYLDRVGGGGDIWLP
jgi:FAD:protein FMN transferase